jgi:hypothetical protein
MVGRSTRLSRILTSFEFCCGSNMPTGALALQDASAPTTQPTPTARIRCYGAAPLRTCTAGTSRPQKTQTSPLPVASKPVAPNSASHGARSVEQPPGAEASACRWRGPLQNRRTLAARPAYDHHVPRGFRGLNRPRRGGARIQPPHRAPDEGTSRTRCRCGPCAPPRLPRTCGPE